MARFEGMTSGQTTLQAQLSTNASGAGSVAFVVGLRAAGENASGSASHPVAYRPSTVGTGTPKATEVRSMVGAVPSATFLTSYTVAPSLCAAPGLGAWNLPFRTRWEVAPRDAIVVGGQGIMAGLVLYALSSGGHLWTGEIVFEEA